MVRVAGLKQLVASAQPRGGRRRAVRRPTSWRPSASGRTPWWRSCTGTGSRTIEPGLRDKGIHILRPPQLTADQKVRLQQHFSKDVWPVLTPLAVDQGHPFPALRNRSLNLAILLHREKQRVARRSTIIAVVQVPAVLPRLVEVPVESDGSGRPGSCCWKT